MTLFGNEERATTKSSRTKVYKITPLGKNKIPQYEGQGLIFDILTKLASDGACSIGEIVKDTHTNWNDVSYKLSYLEDLGYVTLQGKSGGFF